MPINYPSATVNEILRSHIKELVLEENEDGTWTTWTTFLLVDTLGNIQEIRMQHEMQVLDENTIASINNLMDTVHVPNLETDLGV